MLQDPVVTVSLFKFSLWEIQLGLFQIAGKRNISYFFPVEGMYIIIDTTRNVAIIKNNCCIYPVALPLVINFTEGLFCVKVEVRLDDKIFGCLCIVFVPRA